MGIQEGLLRKGPAGKDARAGAVSSPKRGLLGKFTGPIQLPSQAVTLATSLAVDDIIDTTTAHGFVAGDVVKFTALTGGAGLVTNITYFVIATSLGATTFRVALTPGGAGINFTTDITAGTVVKANDGVPLGVNKDIPIVTSVVLTPGVGTISVAYVKDAVHDVVRVLHRPTVGDLEIGALKAFTENEDTATPLVIAGLTTGVEYEVYVQGIDLDQGASELSDRKVATAG